ncbi:MAG: RNA polymerase sigma factor [Candidatus Dormibacteraeota bacterium]|nr:RNA polymerase sigma factor [Candidatus Dormibacteraeota bacterium]
MASADDLVERAKDGDGQALELLLERHLPMVYRLVSMKLGRDHADLDDVVQETLIAAARSIKNLRAERDGAVPAWFLTIARHKVADHMRGAQRKVEKHAVPDTQDVQEIVGDRDRDRRLREAMTELTSEQEEVLLLRFVLGFGTDQTAAITRRTPGAVKALQHRGLASLERILEREAVDWR